MFEELQTNVHSGVDLPNPSSISMPDGCKDGEGMPSQGCKAGRRAHTAGLNPGQRSVLDAERYLQLLDKQKQHTGGVLAAIDSMRMSYR